MSLVILEGKKRFITGPLLFIIDSLLEPYFSLSKPSRNVHKKMRVWLLSNTKKKIIILKKKRWVRLMMDGCAFRVSGSELWNEVWWLLDEAGSSRKTMIAKLHSFQWGQNTRSPMVEKGMDENQENDEYHANDCLHTIKPQNDLAFDNQRKVFIPWTRLKETPRQDTTSLVISPNV